MSEVPAPAPDKPQHLEATRALRDVVADAEQLRGHPRRLQRALELLSTLASRSARDTLRHSRADIIRGAAALLCKAEELDADVLGLSLDPAAATVEDPVEREELRRRLRDGDSGTSR